ncbi:MAG: AmmeMemoRadiSam system protein B [Anaerolineae bacterium]|nr:AmmeMemoRadiSam system protein B [Anaerolineae bacterium]MDW8070580.1 AmmeMemoRadiSam system protein B [Anaerolineae bacterium]
MVVTPSVPSPASPTPDIPAGKVRPAEFAGAWYPDDAETLQRTVDQLLGQVDVHIGPSEGTPFGLVVPHAGYIYSGAVAAAGFKQLEGHALDTAVIVSADHQQPLSRPIAVYAEGGFATPLGVVPVDIDLARALIAVEPRIKADTSAHAREHMIEIELPFLQRVCPTCRIVPILIGDDTDEIVDVLAAALLKVLPGRRAVVIASSDLSHYPSAPDAREVDTTTLDAILTGNPRRVRQTIAQLMERGYANLFTCACGETAILATMQVARGLGADTITLLRYANSAEVLGSPSDQAVGYGAVLFWRYRPPALTPARQQELLHLARTTLATHLENGQLPEYHTADAELTRRLGAFVTLKKGGELRGCIGHLQADAPLWQVVQRMAIAAATTDPRFSPLTRAELDQVTIEISVLSPLNRLDNWEAIQVGTHGLVLDYHGQRGVFLPQVAVEQGWDRAQYLDNLCLKAGVPKECWRDPAAKLYTFTALVFGEPVPERPS